ncbi:hypothetical protein [Streptomyces sp. NPDC059761]|uniref:hypothetical protein n=1 Tax=Streptomyces sp. NPDC059761 TaxID=3346937 RepID=UPI00364AEEB1
MNPAWSYLLTLVGAIGLYTAGRARRMGWLIGFCAQGLWAAYAVATDQPGFLISAFIYAYVYALNYRAWRTHQPALTSEKSEA